MSISPIGWNTIRRLRRDFGSLDRAMRVGTSHLIKAGLRSARIQILAQATRVDGSRLLSIWAERGLHFLEYEDPAFPESWRRISAPPSCVLVDGDPAALAARCIAIIGTRAMTGYGEQVTTELASRAARLGRGTVAGLARGVDGAAHRASLAAGAITVGILAGGFDRFYPAEHWRLGREIVAKGGALVSEVAPDATSLPQRFIARNRLVAALAECVIVVEAGLRSGTITTVRHALDMGTEVLAVPGPITSEVSAGCNKLIWDGATPLISLMQLDEVLGSPALRDIATADPVLNAIRAGANDLPTLSERLGLPVAELLQHLTKLELAGTLRRAGAGSFLLC